MSEEIHSLYHPDGCKCAICEITADDGQPEAYDGKLCSHPCYGCTVLTCMTHPDHRPKPDVTKPPESRRASGGVKFQHKGHSAEYWYDQYNRIKDDHEWIQYADDHGGHWTFKGWHNMPKEIRENLKEPTQNANMATIKELTEALAKLRAAYQDKVDEVVTLRYQLGQQPVYAHGEYEPVRYVIGTR